MTERQNVRPGRIGAWRLLDILQATLPWRASLIAGGVVPRYGLPDPPMDTSDPEHELPDSNISEHERRVAVEQERARRFVRARRLNPRRWE